MCNTSRQFLRKFRTHFRNTEKLRNKDTSGHECECYEMDNGILRLFHRRDAIKNLNNIQISVCLCLIGILPPFSLNDHFDIRFFGCQCFQTYRQCAWQIEEGGKEKVLLLAVTGHKHRTLLFIYLLKTISMDIFFLFFPADVLMQQQLLATLYYSFSCVFAFFFSKFIPLAFFICCVHTFTTVWVCFIYFFFLQCHFLSIL